MQELGTVGIRSCAVISTVRLVGFAAMTRASRDARAVNIRHFRRDRAEMTRGEGQNRARASDGREVACRALGFGSGLPPAPKVEVNVVAHLEQLAVNLRALRHELLLWCATPPDEGSADAETVNRQ